MRVLPSPYRVTHLLARLESGLPLARSSIKLHLLKICVSCRVSASRYGRFAICERDRRPGREKSPGRDPTPPGDILHVESEIVEITPSRSKPHQGIITVRGTMFNRNRGGLPVDGQAFGIEAPAVIEGSPLTQKLAGRSSASRVRLAMAAREPRRDFRARHEQLGY
jgi:hypothetical protein